MAGNKNSGRRPRPNAKRTSIIVDVVALETLRFCATKEKRTASAVVQQAIEEYFLNHYEDELMEKVQPA